MLNEDEHFATVDDKEKGFHGSRRRGRWAVMQAQSMRRTKQFVSQMNEKTDANDENKRLF